MHNSTGLLRLVFAFVALLPCVLFAAPQRELDHAAEDVQEIIVTSTLHRSRAETALPVNVLAGEELREKLGATLGETLETQVGVNTASFGAGVGAPVIRGQSGNRVQILQGGIGNIDASAVSADHANSIEPALAQRIEVVRGPSTLLYGNGAIGGVVNVIDNRIPTSLPIATSGLLETRHNNGSDRQVSVMQLEGSAGQLAWHIDGVYRDSNNVEVSGFAINPAQVDFSDSEAHEELLGSRGYLANSNARGDVKTLGASWILEQGYVGLSFNQLRNQYGIPPGAHEQHEGGLHGHGHGEEDVDLDAVDVDNNVRILMQQSRADFELQLPLSGWFEEVHGRVSTVDYQHAEVEANGEVGTLFEQEGLEGRFAFHFQGSESYQGVLGVHFSHRNFSALGDEAFIPATDIDSAALFSVHSFDRDAFTYEFGLRAERQRLQQRRGRCEKSDLSWSGSSSAIWQFSEQANALFSLSHSQRTATIEELYSNIDTACNALADERLVSHAATRRMEIGNPNTDREKSTNIEIGLRRHLGRLTGEFNLFYNDITDYIFLLDTGEYVDEFEVARYSQEDVVFKGFEIELAMPLLAEGNHLTELSLFSDYVSAEFNSSGNVPRIPPLRIGAELSHSHLHWQAKLRWTEVQKQSKQAFNETDTDGYSLLNFYADYHLEASGNEVLLFLKASNLLDESIRHHTSLLKDVAPAAGRAVEIGMRWNF